MHPARRSTDRPRASAPRSRSALLRALPTTRWIARRERGEAYYFWQHEHRDRDDDDGPVQEGRGHHHRHHDREDEGPEMTRSRPC